MHRHTKVLNVSLPPEMAAEYEKIAKFLKKNKSELFREMMETYKQERWIRAFREIQSYGVHKARERGIYTEKDVERLVFGGR